MNTIYLRSKAKPCRLKSNAQAETFANGVVALIGFLLCLTGIGAIFGIPAIIFAFCSEIFGGDKEFYQRGKCPRCDATQLLLISGQEPSLVNEKSFKCGGCSEPLNFFHGEFVYSGLAHSSMDGNPDSISLGRLSFFEDTDKLKVMYYWIFGVMGILILVGNYFSDKQEQKKNKMENATRSDYVDAAKAICITKYQDLDNQFLCSVTSFLRPESLDREMSACESRNRGNYDSELACKNKANDLALLKFDSLIQAKNEALKKKS